MPFPRNEDMKRTFMMAAHLHVNNSVCTIALTGQQDKITMEVASIQARDGEAIPITCNTEYTLHPQQTKYRLLILAFSWHASDV